VLQTLWNLSRAGAADQASVAVPAGSSAAAAAMLSAASTGKYAGPEQGYPIACADSPNPKNPADYQAEAALFSVRSGAAASYIGWGDEPCVGWRATDADGYFGPWNHQTAHPILLVGNSYDPATPYQDSVAMSRELADARLLTMYGYGHTALDNPSRLRPAVRSQLFRRRDAAPNRDRLPAEPAALLGRPPVSRSVCSAWCRP
jgi:hypothetical protein